MRAFKSRREKNLRINYFSFCRTFDSVNDAIIRDRNETICSFRSVFIDDKKGERQTNNSSRSILLSQKVQAQRNNYTRRSNTTGYSDDSHARSHSSFVSLARFSFCSGKEIERIRVYGRGIRRANCQRDKGSILLSVPISSSLIPLSSILLFTVRASTFLHYLSFVLVPFLTFFCLYGLSYRNATVQHTVVYYTFYSFPSFLK